MTANWNGHGEYSLGSRLWVPSWSSLSLFSFVIGVAIIITAPFAAGSAARGSVLQRLFERVTIGVFMLWVVVVSIYGLAHIGQEP
jgi:hypothetical protein